MGDSVLANTGRKRRTTFIFYVILGLIPVLFLIIVEVSLRAIDYGHNYELFIKKEGGVSGAVYVNPNVSYKYFGASQSAVFDSRVGFYEKKPENSIRVFVLGGSTTQGFPYNKKASFPSHLQRRLDLIYPDRPVEVINLGASAINSYTLLDILPAVIDQSPDLILIYAGHNEYYGALGVGSSKSTNPTLARVLLYLRNYRLVQLLENTIAYFRKGDDSNEKNLMQQMIGQSFIEFESEAYNAGINQYDRNLTSILTLIKQAEVPVIVGTLASNIKDQTPFQSKTGINQASSALDYYEKASRQLETADSLAAKANFILAKDYDGLRFRAPEEINHIIRTKANSYNIPLVDIDSVFSRHSPYQITGSNLMCDHLHPNLDGYFLMSQAFYEVIDKYKLLPQPPTNWQENTYELDSVLLAEFPYTSFDSVLDRHILLGGLGQYPFVEQNAPNPYQAELDNDGIYFNTKSVNDIDSVRIQIAIRHLRNGNTRAFKKEMSVFTSYFPYSETRYLHAINQLSRFDALNEGYPYIYENLNKIKASNARTRALGLYFKYYREYDSALFYLNQVLQEVPDDPLLLLDIGFIHLDAEEYQKAIDFFTRVIAIDPNNQEAYHQRAVGRFDLKDYSGTIEDINQSIKLQAKPDTISYLIRGYAHLGTKNQNQACNDWKTAADLGSKSARMLYQTYCNN